ncbi:hypothetical protein F5887DRAFT_956684 [Amanita rubescens]|nr:hypothetical protein F5887DRAFT_956684 [Amanita rubescens]
MNYFTFVNGLPAYLIMKYFLGCLAFCIGGTRWPFNIGNKSTLLFVILHSSDITALYLIIYQLVSLYTLP